MKYKEDEILRNRWYIEGTYMNTIQQRKMVQVQDMLRRLNIDKDFC